MTDTDLQNVNSTKEILRQMREDALGIFNAALQAVDPAQAILDHCSREGDLLQLGSQRFDLAAIDRIVVIGSGKAAAAMAQAIETLVGERIAEGLICVKYGHGLPLKHIRSIEAGHPLPDQEGVQAAGRILEMVERAGVNDLIIFLVSGGGSALLPLPVTGISLRDKQITTQTLLACGASIHEINALRKHLSAIKGGRLAQAASPATMMTLILSDVVGDDLDVIASGPAMPDSSTFQDCWDIIERYAIEDQLPENVLTHLKAGKAGSIPETPKKDTHDWRRIFHLIVANNFQAIRAAAQAARNKGYAPLILSSCIQGETREAAGIHGAIAREVAASGHPIPAPACILSGGETTVTLKGTGKGGRNQEFALAAAQTIAGTVPMVLLSGGTDGTDGPTDAAGAIIDHTTAQRAANLGLDINTHLNHNDAYPFFQQLGDLLITGPTRTNVMDVRVMLIGTSE